MLEKDLLPIFVTGPLFTGKQKTDRAFIIKYLLKRRYKIVLPDSLSEDNPMLNTSNAKIVKHLLKKTDSFEYILASISLHHFSVGVTDSSHFELGQFHNLLSRWHTTYFQPSFKDTEFVDYKYKTGKYIEMHYKESVKKYSAFYKFVGTEKKNYYPSLSFDINYENNKPIYPIPWTLKRALKSYGYKGINFNVRANTAKMYRYSSITVTTDFPRSKAFLPIKQAYIMFIHFFANEKTFIKSNLSQPHLIFNKFIDHIRENFIEANSIEILASRERTSNNSLMYAFLYILNITFSRRIKDRNMKLIAENIKKSFDRAQNNNPYKTIVMRRRNKTRSLTTYNLNLAGDMKRKEHEELEREFSISPSSTAYVSYSSYIDNVSRHRKNIEQPFYKGVKLDLKNFFEKSSSLNKMNIEDINEYKQGTITGPALANASFYEIDSEIISYLPSDIVYTRYSDDILITGPEHIDIDLITERVIEIITNTGYELNESKTMKFSELDRVKVTGLIINNGEIRIPNRMSKKIVEWSINPSKHSLTYKYIKSLIDLFDEYQVGYKSEWIIKRNISGKI